MIKRIPMRGRGHTPPPPPPPDRDNERGGGPGLSVPVPVWMLLAAILLAVIAHTLLTTRMRQCALWSERPSPVVEVRR